MLRLTATIVQPSDTLKTNQYLLRLGIYIPTNVAAEVIMCDIWCIYGFGGLIDGFSALGVVYEVSLEVVMTTHA